MDNAQSHSTEREDAAVAKLRADAAAVTLQAKAQADVVKAQADAVTLPAYKQAALDVAPLAAVCAVGLFLGADLVLHDVRSVQRWRMLQRLRRCKVPISAQTQPAKPLPFRTAKLRLGKLPTLFYGFSGNGKTAEMALIARETASPSIDSGVQPCPVVYIHLRPSGGVDSASSADATVRLEATARQVYEQIGYPSRVSHLSMVQHAIRIRLGGIEGELARAARRARFADSFRALFEVAERIYHERKAAGIPEAHAPMVVLIEGVEGLITSKRMADAGGRFVFEELAGMLVAYGVDRGKVRTAVTGSSAVLSVEFDKTVASGARWNYHKMVDPARDTIIKALIDSGYSAGEADSMVELVGTRLRLLDSPLTRGAEKISCDSILRSARDVATANFVDLLHDRQVRESLVDILERIVAHEAGHGKAPCLYDMSPWLRAVDFTQLLFVQLDRKVTFQSQLHRNMWSELRSDYISPQLK